MFVLILVFFLSFISEIILLVLTSPLTDTGAVNHIVVWGFAINSGILLGILYTFLLIGFYLMLKAYTELQRRSFLRRGFLFGGLVTSLLLFKLYNFFDIFIAGFLIIVFIALDLIFSQKSE